MSNQATAQEAVQPITRESLNPPSMGGPQVPTKPEVADESATDEAVADTEATEDLAEAQETEQDEVTETVQEAALGRMELNEFLREAGISHEEFYRDIYKVEDGKEVSMSAAWDERKSLKEANEALLKERNELQQKVNQAAVQMPQMSESPEAANLRMQAQQCQHALVATDWSQMDAATAASQKVDLQVMAQQYMQAAQQKQMEHQEKVEKTIRERQEEAEIQTRKRIPEWTDTRVRDIEWQNIADMMHPYGIPRQEVDNIRDPRYRHFLRDALKATAEKQRIVEGARKIRKVSKKTLEAAARSPIKSGEPDLKQVQRDIRDARKKGKTRAEIQKMRLEMPLP